jgi:hypothetical protein
MRAIRGPDKYLTLVAPWLRRRGRPSACAVRALTTRGKKRDEQAIEKRSSTRGMFVPANERSSGRCRQVARAALDRRTYTARRAHVHRALVQQGEFRSANWEGPFDSNGVPDWSADRASVGVAILTTSVEEASEYGSIIDLRAGPSWK